MKIGINREYLVRHLFVTVLMVGLAGWFGFDGFVRYPQTDAAALYESIERDAPPPGMTSAELQRFKEQKTGFQRMFALALLLVGAVVGVRLLKSARFSMSFDGDGFVVDGTRYSYVDIKGVEDAEWAKKGIARVLVKDRKIVLDAWHHTGVKDFYEKIKNPR